MSPERADADVFIFPTQYMFQHLGAKGSVTLRAAESHEWTASASVPWIHLCPPTRGRGPQTLEYQVEPNPHAGRHGHVILAGRRLTVLQLSAPQWQKRQVFAAPLPIIEQVGLQGFMDQAQKLPPVPRLAAYTGLLLFVGTMEQKFQALYTAAPQVPQQYTASFIGHEASLSCKFIRDHMQAEENKE